MPSALLHCTNKHDFQEFRKPILPINELDKLTRLQVSSLKLPRLLPQRAQRPFERLVQKPNKRLCLFQVSLYCEPIPPLDPPPPAHASEWRRRRPGTARGPGTAAGHRPSSDAEAFFGETISANARFGKRGAYRQRTNERERTNERKKETKKERKKERTKERRKNERKKDRRGERKEDRKKDRKQEREEKRKEEKQDKHSIVFIY